MSHNKVVVRRYIHGFKRSDHEQILSCMIEDITWTVFGAFRLERKRLTTRRSRTCLHQEP